MTFHAWLVCALLSTVFMLTEGEQEAGEERYISLPFAQGDKGEEGDAESGTQGWEVKGTGRGAFSSAKV